jgi:serine/threonine protein kinase
MGNREEWQEIEPLGEGGQSKVFKVRRPERTAERARCVEEVILHSGGVNAKGAPIFAQAVWNYARPGSMAELGALKVFKTRGAGPEAEQRELERLKSEITILAQNRRGLARLLDSNEEERWIVTEYLPGGTLSDHALTYKGNVALALKAFRSLVETVASLHKEGIVHRDIKPANVFIAADGQLVLGDFGIAYLPDLPHRPTGPRESVGPHECIPPWGDLGERLEKVQPNFDVYMLGKLLWCMVSGRLRLPREWYRRPEYDLTQPNPADPQMHMVNIILDRCVVEDPKKCLGFAEELLPVLDDCLLVIGAGGQLLTQDAPRPCRICGKGLYKAVGPGGGLAGTQLLNDNRVQVGAIYFRLFICDYCQHVEFFKVSN